jgi:hypothetical protein
VRTFYPECVETLDVVFISTALAEARELLVKWRKGMTPDAEDLDAIKEILRRDEILTTETER